MKKINTKQGLWLNLQKDVRPQYYSLSENHEHHYHEVKNSSVGRFMYDNGMAQTRAIRFAEAIEMIFSALCHCDSRNLQIVLKDYPELLTIAQFYSKRSLNFYQETKNDGNNFGKFRPRSSIYNKWKIKSIST